jgi:endoglucanase
MKAYWAKATILAAEENGMSWNYWGFVGVGGFEAAYRDLSKKVYWYEGFPAAFGF